MSCTRISKTFRLYFDSPENTTSMDAYEGMGLTRNFTWLEHVTLTEALID